MKNYELEPIAAKIEEKRDIYISLIKKNYGSTEEMASDVFTSENEAYIERLKDYYNEQYKVKEKRGLPEITEFQGVNIFLEVMQMGLSFAPAAGLVYLSRLKGTGKSVGYQITGKGEIYLCQKAGSIDHLSEVVIVRNGEEFSIKSKNDGTKWADHTLNFDGSGFNYENDFKCGYVYLVYPSGDRELYWVNRATMDKARSLSMNKAMYNDESFLKTKVIRRALKNVNKTPFLLMNRETPDFDNDDVENLDDVDYVGDVPYYQEEEPQTNVEESSEVEEKQESNNKEESQENLFGDLDLDFD